MSQLCCLAASLLLVTTLVPTPTKTWHLSVDNDAVHQRNLNRLKQMYLDSHKLASQSMQETNMLKHLKQNFLADRQLANGHSLDKNNQVEPNEGKFLVHLDSSQDQVAERNYELMTGDESNSPAFSQGDGGLVPIRKFSPSKSNARQTSLFSGFQLPGASNPLGSNSLMNNLLKPPAFPDFPKLPTLPTLPPIPTFQPSTPKPSRPPKSSIIGNTGGPMSLTNDNVVVVNVLSNNY